MSLQYDETDISLKGANYLNSQIYYLQILKTAAEKGKLANNNPNRYWFSISLHLWIFLIISLKKQRPQAPYYESVY